MDQYTKNLLTSWGFAELIPRFKEENIDAPTLRGLNENEMIQLIPNIGMRSRFRNKFEPWKANKKRVELPADPNAPLSNLLEEAERNEPSISANSMPKKSEVQRKSVRLSDERPFPPGICRNYLLKTELGRSLLAKAKKQEIVVEDRNNASVLVIDAILKEEPSRRIKSAAFQCLANELCEIFPGTSPAFFFLPSLPKTPFQKQRSLSGHLYTAYVKKRDKLRKRGVLPPSVKSATSNRSTIPTSHNGPMQRSPHTAGNGWETDGGIFPALWKLVRIDLPVSLPRRTPGPQVSASSETDPRRTLGLQVSSSSETDANTPGSPTQATKVSLQEIGTQATTRVSTRGTQTSLLTWCPQTSLFTRGTQTDLPPRTPSRAELSPLPTTSTSLPRTPGQPKEKKRRKIILITEPLARQ